MKTVPLLACLLLAACAAPSPDATVDAWTPLFNGRDLSGWQPKIRGEVLGADARGTFRVEDGLLRVGYDGYDDFGGRFGHLFYERPFGHYRLRVEYRFHGPQVPGGPGWALRNSGVMLHAQDPATMALDQEFPVSIEAQFLGGNGSDPRPTANLCTPGTHVEMEGELVRRHCTNSTSPTFHGEGWVTVELEVRGGRVVRHWVGDEKVLEYAAPQLDPGDGDAGRLLEAGAPLLLTEGFLALQSESHPIDFRRVEILELDPEDN